MEQPQGNANNLQPQDLSLTCSLPSVIDLTRRSEECHPKASSMDPLRVVKSSSWYTNSGSNKGLPFPEPSSDQRLHSGDQIQPDNAFSNTTVTLSYVSRSHVFSTHESQHSPLCGVPSISKFSLCPTSCKLEEESEEMVELNQEVSQHYLHQQADKPLDLASQSQPTRHAVSPTRAASGNVAGVCRTQLPRELNGGHAATNGSVDGHGRRSTPPERRPSQDAAPGDGGLRNGRRSRSDSGVRAGSLPERHASDTEDGRREGKDSEVLLLISRTENPALLPDRSPRDLCAVGGEYSSPLEDPVSPSATSLEDVYLLPEASSSPSGDNSPADARWDEPERAGRETRAVEGPALDPGSRGHPEDARSVPSEAVIDLTDDGSASEAPEEKAKDGARSPHLNGNARLAQNSFEKKKLPPRSGRGTRLEAIVMNINPTWYKVSEAVRPSKKIKATQAQMQTEISASEAVGSLSVGQEEVEENGALPPEIKIKLHSAPTLEKGKNSIHKSTDSYTESTSDLELAIPPQHTHNSFTPKSPQSATDKGSPTEESPPVSDPEPPSIVDVTGDSSPAKAEKKSPPKQKAKASASKVPPSKRKRPKYNACQPSMFSPKEPEIRLKYLHYKEEKRDLRAMDSFSPFIQVERKRVPSTCMVINYPEEDAARLKKGHQQASSGGFIPGAIPTTSCLQPGRVSTHSPYQNSLVCCLCGGSANALDLGDLHGPYYPEGYRPRAKTPASTGVKEEEEDSDSDSSFSRRGRKCARPPGVWTHRPAPRHSQDKSLLGSHPRWTSYTDHSSSPAAKRARAGAESLEASGPEAGTLEGAGPGGRATEDWYAPPVVPLEPCEYWLHEDCCVWSAGVFLVKGKVYGLEEAVKVAQETTCSGCHNPGATLGCFFKGCPNKYHYRCALQSGRSAQPPHTHTHIYTHSLPLFHTNPVNPRSQGQHVPA
ncbi:transcription factor 20 isoform X1 [Hypomesus transpacificus]|uniref:transcription factor 20 isoform X1 n=1 Tax=Hypomesus transpacificus TaxID=137520 RepID=UPI001F079808|nr:transcription factor 20 isoform X1 [Hypomesus transpacificus]XP_046888288.1 transcription factor 20 isoform X1 [Hypomesus transpacificus]XP_046888289.1 transcription factor 20 isoform X1 [Hypomesus transpacificus]